MHNYDSMRDHYGSRVSQTIDSPIMVFDYFELSDVFLAVAVVMVFGVIFYMWLPMFLLLVVTLGILPVIKRRYPKGILLHWPYKNLNMSLPGLVNPGGKKKSSH